ISPNQNVTTGDELICNGFGFDIDQSVGLIEGYLWTNNTTNEPLGTTNTYTVDSTNTDVGDELVCTYSVEDSGGLTVTNSASVTIENTNPVISNLSISPQNPYNDQAITCSGQATDIDDSGSPSIAYNWMMNGNILAEDVATLNLADLSVAVAPGEVLECSASAEDNNGGSVQQSVFVTVANRPPSMLTVEILPQEPEEGVDDLICLGDGSTDADNQPLSNSYVWTSSSGVTINGDTVPALNLIEGETWTCAATVTDGIAQVTQTETVVVGPYCEYGTCDFTLDVGNSIQMEMNLIPAGVDPLERYEITQDFYMGTTEVTQEVAEELLVSISAPINNIGSGAKYPYNASSWHENAYLANLVTDKHNDTEGSTLEHCYDCDNNGSSVECYPNQNPYLCDGYRLPTSAEWEYAARSGTTNDFWTGNGFTDGGDYDSDACNSSVTINDSVSSSLQDFAWFCGNQNSNNYTTLTKPVAQKLPNGFGLYDMHGNVSERTTEWTYQDFSSFDFPAQYANPYQFDEWGDHAIIRGGNGGERPSDIRSGQWSMESLSTNASSTFGLRLVRTVRTIPSEPEILISPEFNDGTTDMFCEVDVDSIDPNAFSVGYTIEWELNGQAYSGAVSTTSKIGDTIPASALTLGDTFRCIVTPDNGIQSGFEVIAQSGVCDTTACDQSIPLGDGSGIDFVLIKEGFEPLGQYQIHQDFYMMTVEVTQNMFHELLGFYAHGDIINLPDGYINNDLPAGGMSWFEAAFFANALTERHNAIYPDSLDYCYDCEDDNGVIYCIESMPPKACNGYSLPTEAEWMYAARSHSPTDFWTGGGSDGGGSASSIDVCGNGINDTTVTILDGDVNPPFLSSFAWFCGNAQDPNYPDIMKPGASLLPNGFGLFDMHGNLSEWTADQFVNNPLAGIDPWNTGDGLLYILKGGGWSDTTSLLTAGSRMFFAPGQGIEDTGVRLVRRVVSGPSAVTLSFFSPSETTPLICEIDSVAVDPNNDNVYYQFDWYFNGVPYTGQPAMTYHEDDTIPATDLSPGNWACHVTPTDLVHEGPTIIIEVDL
ncbi:MAG: SUMF1/EgtB/PvdO family nonheme iron enzyme, partial [Myxococcota bacterium]|nr:SUMF1/EgtB/PvdO family nonheme iron enzyme [Myxococcota bacterium]